MTDGTDAHASSLVRDLSAPRGPLIAVGSEKAQLHEFVRAQQFLEFGEELRGEAGAADLQVIRQPLAEPAQVGFLGAGERKVIHEYPK